MNQVWWGKESDFWRGLGADLEGALVPCGCARQWPAGTELLAQGDDEGIVIIQKGLVHLTSRRGGDRELTLARLGPGEVFGRATWLPEGVAGARCLVREDLSGWMLDREALERLLVVTPEVPGKLAATVHALWQVEGPVGPAAGRIRRLLLSWGADHGQTGPQGMLVPGLLSPAEIAELVGATREEVERCLRAWRACADLLEESDHFRLRHPGEARPV